MSAPHAGSRQQIRDKRSRLGGAPCGSAACRSSRAVAQRLMTRPFRTPPAGASTSRARRAVATRDASIDRHNAPGLLPVMLSFSLSCGVPRGRGVAAPVGEVPLGYLIFGPNRPR
jgi:hypothetical protein